MLKKISAYNWLTESLKQEPEIRQGKCLAAKNLSLLSPRKISLNFDPVMSSILTQNRFGRVGGSMLQSFCPK